jgi:drug/metabolite transporter (DMT)-like permease
MAIGSNLTFSTASMVFALYARRFSSMWINQVKVVVAVIAFFASMILSQEIASIGWTSTILLLLSGLSGLCIGDIFLFRAYATLGAGRSLILFSCQPLMLGLYGYFFLGQIFTLNQSLSVICMIICIFIFMLERSKLTGSWDFKSFMWAFLGISMDAIGVMLTRTSYEFSPELQSFQANFIRCLGAIIGFILINPKSYLQVSKDIIALNKKEKLLVLGAAFGGCFVSLSMYLTALKYAHVGTLTSISITGPVWVAILESLYHRRLPSPYLLGAFAFFSTGLYLMVIA